MKRSGPPERRTPLKRSLMQPNGPSLKRTRIKPKKVERDWTAARAKVAREKRCRVCERVRVRLEAAHVIGRTHDKPQPERGGPRWVHPDDVVPLCSGCHGKYDRRELDLWPVLTAAEWERAVLHVGAGSARRRISGRP